MKITEKQIMYLLTVLKDSLSKNILGIHSISFENRSKLYSQLVNQQSNTLIDVDDNEKNKDV